MQEFQVILNYDVVFSVLKGFTWIVFLFRVVFIYYKVYPFRGRNESRHIIVSNTLYIYCLISVCSLANEWKVVDTFFFPYWMMLGQVFLILMCIIFEHGSAASIVITCSCAFTLGLMLFFYFGRSGSSYWTVGNFECWLGCGWGLAGCVWVMRSWRCERSMPFSCQTITVNVGDSHFPASYPSFCDLFCSSLVRLHHYNCEMP